jgi:hypothetical protein
MIHRASGLLLISVLALLPVPVRSQFKIALGGNLGIAITRQASLPQTAAPETVRLGMIVTAQTDWGGRAPLVLQDQLSYIQKGYSWSAQDSVSKTIFTRNLSYVELSLAPKYRFGTSGFRPYVFAGPHAALLISANESTNKDPRKLDLKPQLRTMELGINFGAGAEYELGPQLYALAYLGQSYGMTEIFREFDGDTYLNSSKIVIGVLYEL